LFLHDLNYNFFNINALTYSELNALVSAYNRRTKEQQRKSNK